MKLIHCTKCQDVVRLQLGEVRECKCGSSGGIYIDQIMASVWGPFCNPLAIANEDMAPMKSGAPYLAGTTELIRSWWIKRGATDSHEVKYYVEKPEEYNK